MPIRVGERLAVNSRPPRRPQPGMPTMMLMEAKTTWTVLAFAKVMALGNTRELSKSDLNMKKNWQTRETMLRNPLLEHQLLYSPKILNHQE